MWDADNRSSVYVGAVVDSPDTGLTSYSTLNLSDWPLYVDGRVHETRIEMMGAAPSEIELFENAVSTAAFCVINEKWQCYPGRYFPRRSVDVPPVPYDEARSLHRAVPL